MNFIGPRPVILSEEKLLILRHSYGIDSQQPGILLCPNKWKRISVDRV